MNQTVFFVAVAVVIGLTILVAYLSFLQEWVEVAARRYVPVQQGTRIVVDLGKALGHSIVPMLVQRIGFRRYGGMLVIYSSVKRYLHWLKTVVTDKGIGITPIYLFGHAITDIHERELFDAIILINGLVAPNHQIPVLDGLFTALEPGGILSITEARWLSPHHPPDAVRQMAQAAGFVEHAFFSHRLLYTIQFEKPTPPNS